jgi:hypothetical protein
MKKIILSTIVSTILTTVISASTTEPQKIYLPSNEWSLIGIKNCGPLKLDPINAPIDDLASGYQQITVRSNDTKRVNNQYPKFINNTDYDITFIMDNNVTTNNEHLNNTYTIKYIENKDDNTTDKELVFNYDKAMDGERLSVNIGDTIYYLDLKNGATKTLTKDFDVEVKQGKKGQITKDINIITINNNSQFDIFVEIDDEGRGVKDSSTSYYLKIDGNKADLLDDATDDQLIELIVYGIFEDDEDILIKIADKTPYIINLKYSDILKFTDETNPYIIYKPEQLNIDTSIKVESSNMDGVLKDVNNNAIIDINNSNDLKYTLTYPNKNAVINSKYIEFLGKKVEIQYLNGFTDTGKNNFLQLISNNERSKKITNIKDLSSAIESPTLSEVSSTTPVDICSIDNMLWGDLSDKDIENTKATDKFVVYNYSDKHWKRYTHNYGVLDGQNNLTSFEPGKSYWVYRNGTANNLSGIKVIDKNVIDSDYYKNLEANSWHMVSFDNMKFVDEISVTKIPTGTNSFTLTQGVQNLTINYNNLSDINVAIKTAIDTGVQVSNIKAYENPDTNDIYIVSNMLTTAKDMETITSTTEDTNGTIILGKSYSLLVSNNTNIKIKRYNIGDDNSKELSSDNYEMIKLDTNKYLILSNIRFTVEDAGDVYSSSSLLEDNKLLGNSNKSKVLAPEFSTSNHPLQLFNKDISSIWQWNNGTVSTDANKSDSKFTMTAFSNLRQEDMAKRFTNENDIKREKTSIRSLSSSRGYWVQLKTDTVVPEYVFDPMTINNLDSDFNIYLKYTHNLTGNSFSTTVDESNSKAIIKNMTLNLPKYSNMDLEYYKDGLKVSSKSLIPDGEKTFTGIILDSDIFNNGIIKIDSMKFNFVDFRGYTSSGALSKEDLINYTTKPSNVNIYVENVNILKFNSLTSNVINFNDNNITNNNYSTSKRIDIVDGTAFYDIAQLESFNSKKFGDNISKLDAFSSMNFRLSRSLLSDIASITDIYVLNKQSVIDSFAADGTKIRKEFDNDGVIVAPENINVEKSTGVEIYSKDDINIAVAYKSKLQESDIKTKQYSITLQKRNANNIKTDTAILTIDKSTRYGESIFVYFDASMFKIDLIDDPTVYDPSGVEDKIIDLDDISNIDYTNYKSIKKVMKIDYPSTLNIAVQ